MWVFGRAGGSRDWCLLRLSAISFNCLCRCASRNTSPLSFWVLWSDFTSNFAFVQVSVYHLQVILSTEIIKCGLKWLLQNSSGFPTLRLFVVRIIWEFAEFHMFPCEFPVFFKTKWIPQLSFGQMGQAVWQLRSQRCLGGSGQLSPGWKCSCHLKNISCCWRPE